MKFSWPKPGTAAFAMAALLAMVLTSTEGWAKSGSGGRGGGRSSHSGGSGSHNHHRGLHHSRGVSSSVFFSGTYWAFPAYGFAQALPALPAEPVHYIERREEELRSSSMWYYCESEAAYYPYVSQCPDVWVEVEPFGLPDGLP